jgi:hypothetical protein
VSPLSSGGAAGSAGGCRGSTAYENCGFLGGNQPSSSTRVDHHPLITMFNAHSLSPFPIPYRRAIFTVDTKIRFGALFVVALVQPPFHPFHCIVSLSSIIFYSIYWLFHDKCLIMSQGEDNARYAHDRCEV